MDDINQVVKNYYAVICQKDEDIFELYRDNKRLKKQLNEALTGAEEREAEICAVKLLVTTLQTELREKQLLVEAHQSESVTHRNAEWRLREVLRMPSELDHTIEDVVATCIDVHDECVALRAQRERLSGVAVGAFAFGRRVVAEAEQSARGAVAEARDCLHAATAQLLRDGRRVFAAAEQSRRGAAEESRREAARAQVECCQQKRLAREWEERAARADGRSTQLQRCVQAAQAEKELLLEAACSRLDIAEERGADAERMLAFVFRAALRRDQQLQDARREVEDLRGKLEKAQRDLSHNSALLRRTQQQQQQSGLNTSGGDAGADNYKGDDDSNDDDDHRRGSYKRRKSNKSTNLHDAFCALQMEHDALKVDWRKCIERERLTRQQATTTINKLKAERSALEKSAAERLQSCERLERALQRTQLEVKRHAKEAKRLQNLQETLSKEAKSHVERISNLEEMNSLFREENAALILRVNTLQETVSEKEKAFASMERAANERFLEIEQRLGEDKKRFLEEINEWRLSLEETRNKLAAAERDRDREKGLRDMFLEQHRDEKRMLKKLMEEEHKGAVSELHVKIDVLENACRRGAAVIAELREALH